MSELDSNFPEPIDPKDNEVTPENDFTPEPAPVFDEIPAAVSEASTPEDLPESASMDNAAPESSEPTPLPDDFAEPLPESLAPSEPGMSSPPPASNTTGEEPKKDNKKTIWIIVAIVAVLLVICCCITVAIGFGIFQITEETSWEYSKAIPFLQYLL